jgi:hypothetical protein
MEGPFLHAMIFRIVLFGKKAWLLCRSCIHTGSLTHTVDNGLLKVGIVSPLAKGKLPLVNCLG